MFQIQVENDLNLNVFVEDDIDIDSIPKTVLDLTIEDLYQYISERVIKRDKRRRYYTPVKERQKNT